MGQIINLVHTIKSNDELLDPQIKGQDKGSKLQTNPRRETYTTVLICSPSNFHTEFCVLDEPRKNPLQNLNINDTQHIIIACHNINYGIE